MTCEAGMISYTIAAHEQRLSAAAALAHSIDATISWDDGSNGAEGNHLTAWQLASDPEAAWAAVLEDDALPVEGFLEQATQALAVAPAPIVSFYTGTGKPRGWQASLTTTIPTADRTSAHWLTTSRVYHAVAIAIRTDLVKDWLAFAHSSTLPIDERISAWCLMRGHQVAYTWPSLVDHADGPTLIHHRDGQPRTMPRKAHRTGTRHNWTSKAIAL